MNNQALVKATDPDESDTVTIIILESHQWLSVGENDVLSGTQGNDDVGVDIPVSIVVIDAEGLADTLATTVDVINTNDPTSIVTSTLWDSTEKIFRKKSGINTKNID